MQVLPDTAHWKTWCPTQNMMSTANQAYLALYLSCILRFPGFTPALLNGQGHSNMKDCIMYHVGL